jgi:protein-S-isoprenylcysteine O-methyltransferase Ste14
MFTAAGTAKWWRGWICVTAWILCMSVTGVLIKRKNPDVVAARGKWRHKDTKPFDKVFLAVYLPLTIMQPVVAGLEVVRFGHPGMPFVTVYWGIALLLLSMVPITWVMLVNPHAENTVRIQTERHHKTVSAGPYRYVRHPMYVGIILMFASIALILGSWWALLISGFIAVALVCRTALEDRTLRRELPGYEEFAQQTRYRLVPGVW